MKTSELTGITLDYAVAKCEGLDLLESEGWQYSDDEGTRRPYTPSTNWVQGGPIIEREKIRLDCAWSPGPWEGCCKIDGVTSWTEGPTPLIAAMRCFVASKFGEEINIPEELL